MEDIDDNYEDNDSEYDILDVNQLNDSNIEDISTFTKNYSTLIKEFKTDIRAWTPPTVTTGDEGPKRASNQATKMPHEMDAAQKGLKSFSYQNMINNPQQPVIGEGWLDGVEEKAVHIDQPFYISENMGEQFKKTSSIQFNWAHGICFSWNFNRNK